MRYSAAPALPTPLVESRVWLWTSRLGQEHRHPILESGHHLVPVIVVVITIRARVGFGVGLELGLGLGLGFESGIS